MAERNNVRGIIGRVPDSTVMVMAAGRLYPATQDNGCRVCTSEHRKAIEIQLLQSHSYGSIVQALPASAGISAAHVKDHVKEGHLPPIAKGWRQIIERRAVERGMDPEQAGEFLADHITLARLTIQNVLEQMSEGQIRPTIRDAISFARLVAQIEAVEKEGEQGVDYNSVFVSYLNAVRAEVSPDVMQRIGQRIASDPVVRALWQDGQEREERRQRALTVGSPDPED